MFVFDVDCVDNNNERVVMEKGKEGCISYMGVIHKVRVCKCLHLELGERI